MKAKRDEGSQRARVKDAVEVESSDVGPRSYRRVGRLICVVILSAACRLFYGGRLFRGGKGSRRWRIREGLGACDRFGRLWSARCER